MFKRSSPLQLETMVTFMEEHGDLSKPTSNAKGKIETLRSWEELTSLLNSDGTGDTKPTEKWKKVVEEDYVCEACRDLAMQINKLDQATKATP